MHVNNRFLGAKRKRTEDGMSPDAPVGRPSKPSVSKVRSVRAPVRDARDVRYRLTALGAAALAGTAALRRALSDGGNAATRTR